MFVAAVLGLQFLVLRAVRSFADRVPVAAAYGIGAIAAFWTIDRVASFRA